MIRVCAKCKAFLGEKCPECGEAALFHAVTADGRVQARCDDPKCAVTVYFVGEDGATHGYCDACARAMMPAREPEPVDFDSFARRCVAAGYTLRELVRVFRHRVLLAALETTHGNQSAAARRLHLNRNSVWKTLQKGERDAAKKPVLPMRSHDFARKPAAGGER